MGKIIDEYMDIKLQQECVSKTIDTLWKMAQKYQKITEIVDDWKSDGGTFEMSELYWLRLISEVIEDGKEQCSESMGAIDYNF